MIAFPSPSFFANMRKYCFSKIRISGDKNKKLRNNGIK